MHLEYKEEASPAHTRCIYHSKAFTHPNTQLLKPLPELGQSTSVPRTAEGWAEPCSPFPSPIPCSLPQHPSGCQVHGTTSTQRGCKLEEILFQAAEITTCKVLLFFQKDHFGFSNREGKSAWALVSCYDFSLINNLCEIGDWEGKQHLKAPSWNMGNARKHIWTNSLQQLLKRA